MEKEKIKSRPGTIMEIEKLAKSHGKVMEFIFLQISLAFPLRNEKSWKSHEISSPVRGLNHIIVQIVPQAPNLNHL